MSRRRQRDQPAADVAPPTSASAAPAPTACPARHPWQLAISTALLLVWLIFLAWMAWGA